MLGLETALGVGAWPSWTCRSPTSSRRCRGKPAAIAGVGRPPRPPVAAGEPANLVVFDPDADVDGRPGALASRSRNTPYAGRTLRGRVRHTLFRGAAVVVEGVGQR